MDNDDGGRTDDKTVCCPHVSRSTHDSMGYLFFFYSSFAFGSPRLARCNYQADELCGCVVWGSKFTSRNTFFFLKFPGNVGAKAERTTDQIMTAGEERGRGYTIEKLTAICEMYTRLAGEAQ